METACFFLFFSARRGWSADCVSVRGVCGYETSEKNNNTQAHVSILSLNMNMSIPACAHTQLYAGTMLSRITIAPVTLSAH